MKYWKFLADQWVIILAWLIFVGLTAFVMWLSPGLYVDWTLVGYLALIEGVFLFAFLTAYFLTRRHWWGKFDLSDKNEDVLQDYFDGARSHEERMIQDYLNHVLAEHQQAMQDLLEKQQDQKDYIDSWVHEIKVPLAAVNLIMQSVEDDLAEDKYMLVENELEKIDDYVEQVLYYARLDSFSRDYLIQEYSLKSIVQTAVRGEANHFIQKNLHLEITGDDVQVLTDVKWVNYILKQILSNAVKYTANDGHIRILMEQTAGGIALKIRDSGIGIPKEDLHRIFDKGFTGENGRLAEQHSTGLGLYLAYNLAEKLNIRLSAESAEGEGTTMILFFPTLKFYQEDR